MTAIQSYTLGGVKFMSKAAIRRYCQGLLKEGQAHLKGEALDVVTSLLFWHPRASEKIGVGVVGVEVAKSAPWSNSCGFYVHRSDGSTEDFSYRICLEPNRASQVNRAKQAFRSAISFQTVEIKSRMVDDNSDFLGLVWSDAEQAWLKPDQVALDHYPKPFSAILEEFVGWQKLDLAALELGQLDGFPCLADIKLRAMWQSYHARHARYRLISQELNCKLGAHPCLNPSLEGEVTAKS